MAGPRKTKREWYSVSYTSAAVIILGMVAVGGVLGYQRLDYNSPESQADRAIEEATERVEAGRREPDLAKSKEFSQAEALLAEAVEAYDARNFERAAKRGESCLVILAGLENRNEGIIRVLSAQGSVQYRHSDHGTWKRLRAHDRLSAGDWVKTASDGAAELYWKDGSVLTLRQGTLVRIRDRDGVTSLRSGRVGVRTSSSDSTVATPGSRSKVSRDSKALVSFDQNAKTGHFMVLAGRIDVIADDSGQTRTLEANQQADFSRGLLSEASAVPGQPMITQPADNYTIDLGRNDEVRLQWEPVDNARRYALRVSDNPLFSDTFIDRRITKTSARIGVRGEGQYFWQVAALDGRGNPGHWSEVRSFRGKSTLYGPTVNDREPPPLKIVSRDTLGSWVILIGKTEPGATVTVDGEVVTVKGNGTFHAIHQVSKAGKNRLEVVATDAWGNRTTGRVDVFVYGN